MLPSSFVQNEAFTSRSAFRIYASQMMSGGWRDPRGHTLESLRHFFASAVARMGPSTFCSKRGEETRKHAPFLI